MQDRLEHISNVGVSIWLDTLSREMIDDGELAELAAHHVVGVTTNPTIFAHAVSAGHSYDAALAQAARDGDTTDEAIFELTTADVAAACDVFAPTFAATDGMDGRVSIEVGPDFAYDTAGTIAEAHRLHDGVDRPNVLIKIPATREGLPAITAMTAAGVSINITLIFSLDRYREVISAYVEGLRQAQAAGIDLGTIRSVASVFLSRIDTKVDAALEEIGTDAALALRGEAAIANARLCYAAYEELFAEPFADLAAAGAHAQRPLWASTGTKNPDYPDTKYVDSLLAPGVVNTMPRATLEAVAAHSAADGNTIAGTYDAARATLAALAEVGVDLPAIMQDLESEGVESFSASWRELSDTVTAAMNRA